MRKDKGITLIALVITIIVLLILAGVTITLVIGDNGILNKATEAGKDYSEQAARERLEIALADLSVDKATNSAYNENAFIDDNLTKEGMIVEGDIVIVDGWQFQIDRTVPKIIANLGKAEENPQIQIIASIQNSNDYVKSTIKVEVKYKNDISSIQINGKQIEIPEKVEESYFVQTDVMANGIYHIIARDTENKYKIATIEVNELTEDMGIKTAEDMIAFREKVNSGRTFEGKKVTVMNDIDLAGSEQNQWVPIGKDASLFAGTFEGQYHKIKGLYIKTDAYANTALFGKNTEESVIQNVEIDNCYIYNSKANAMEVIAAGIIGENMGTIRNCKVSGTITFYKTLASSSWMANRAGGIAGINRKTIENCCNFATINATNANAVSNEVYIGGITGVNAGNLINSYNAGNVNGNAYNVLIGGISGFTAPIYGASPVLIENCYNVGTITGLGKYYTLVGGTVGANASENYALATINQCYTIDTVAYGNYFYYVTGYGYKVDNIGKMTSEAMKNNLISSLGDRFVQDRSNVNHGYPILKWEIEK